MEVVRRRVCWEMESQPQPGKHDTNSNRPVVLMQGVCEKITSAQSTVWCGVNRVMCRQCGVV